MYKSQSRTVGLTFVKNLNSSSFSPRVYVANDKGSVSIYSVPGHVKDVEKPVEIDLSSKLKKYFTVDKLPKSCEMNTDAFEAGLDISGDNKYDSIFSYSGEFKTLLGSARSSISSYRGSSDPLVKGNEKRSIKLECKLDNIGAGKPHNDKVMLGIRVSIYSPDKLGSSDADGKYGLKIFNRHVKLSGNKKIFEVAFCEAEILYLYSVMKHVLKAEITTSDPINYPINIFGVDIYGKEVDMKEFLGKIAIIEKCANEDVVDDEVVLEMMQSDQMPVLVNWYEKFSSVEKVLKGTKDKEVRDEKRLLFNLAEAATFATEFMEDKDIENDLLYYIHPLIGEYICKVEEGHSKNSMVSKLILQSLMRLLRKSLEKLNKDEPVSTSQIRHSQYTSFINYLRDTLDSHKANMTSNPNTAKINLRPSQVCSFVKVAHKLASEHKKIFFYLVENNYPALVTDLLRLVKHVVLHEIESITSEKRAIPQ